MTAALDAVGCATSASCLAVGTYLDATAQPQAFQDSLQAGLTITNRTLPKAYVAAAYSTTLAASGAWNAYTWSLASGHLPAGLTLSAKTGKISGKPRGTSKSKFKVRVTATGNPAQSITKALSITVVADPAFNFSIPRGGLKLTGKSVSVRARCAKGGKCSGLLKLDYAHQVTLKHRKPRSETTVIGRFNYSLNAGKSRTVKIKLTVAGQRFLELAAKHKLAVTFDATVKGGRSSSQRTTLGVAPIAKK